MTKKLSGTGRPIKKAENLRRVTLALAVLLLASVLMVGSVSAEEKTISSTDFVNGWYEINESGTYILTENAEGSISISNKSGATETLSVTLKAQNNAVLKGMIRVHECWHANIVISDMHLVLNSTIKCPKHTGYVVGIQNCDASNAGSSDSACYNTYTIKNNVITFEEETTPYQSYGFQSDYPINYGSEIVNNEIINVRKHGFVFPGVETGGTLTFTGNKATMNPDEDVGDDSGRALLKVYHYDGDYATYNVENNQVIIAEGNSYNANIFRLDQQYSYVGDLNKMKVNLVNNVIGSEYTKYIYGGDFKAEQLANLFVLDNAGNTLLIKNLNQTGVAWSDNIVKISNAGAYVSQEIGIVLDETSNLDGVTINGKTPASTIILSGDTSLKVGEDGELTTTLETTDGLDRVITWEVIDGVGVISFGNPTTEGKVPFTAVSVGTATIKAKTFDGEATITLNVMGEVTPEAGTDVTVNENGVATIAPSTGGDDTSTITVQTSNDGKTTATIENSGLTITLTSSATVTTTDSNGVVTSITGTFEEVEAKYDDAPAQLSTGGTATSALTIKMTPAAIAANFPMPTIDTTVDTTITAKVTTYEGQTYTPLTMIKASYTGTGGLQVINNNISERGVVLKFTLPDSVGQALVAFHVDDNGKATLLAKDRLKVEVDGTGNILATIEGDSFSSYVLAQGTYPEEKQTNGGSSTPQGSSVWLTESQTPTETPSEQPTTQPTDVAPTTVPTTQPTQTETPGFGVLAVLAGLGAVAVLRRK